mgnify:CR=1 FL=1
MFLSSISSVVPPSVGKGRGRGIENLDFSYLMYWRKQGRGIENWDFSIPFSYTGTTYTFSLTLGNYNGKSTPLSIL